MWVALIVAVVFFVISQLMIPTQKAKSSTLEDFDLPRIDDGSPIYYIAGRIRVNSANLTWYGDFKSKPIKKKAGLFKTSIVGYKYFLGMQLCICLGPGVKLLKVWFGNEEAGWEGSNTGGDFTMKDLQAFGGETGGGGYDLQCTFYPGSTTQTADPYLQSKIDGGLVPGWRGVSYAVMHGYIGNSTSLQTVSYEVERIPDPLGLATKAVIGTEGDVNPANVIYEMLTNNFGALGINPVKLNTASFVHGGNVFYDEDEGISVGFGGNAQQIRDAFQDILRQVDATMYEDPLDGQVYLKLLREDYDIDDLPELNPSSVEEMQSYAINLWTDTKNKVRVTYTDRSRDYKTDAVAVAEDMANIAFQGNEVKPTTAEYPHVKRSAHASRLAARDLNIFSTPIANIRATSLRFDMTLRPGSVIKLSYPEYQIAQLVLRVKSIDLGDLGNNRMVVEVVSDKFARTKTIYGVPGPSLFVKPSLSAASITVAKTLEAPLWFVNAQDDVVDADKPRVMALPKLPNTSQLSYNLHARVVGEADYQEIDTETPYPAYGALYAGYPLSYDYDDTVGLELASLDDEDVLIEATVDQITDQGLNLIMVDDEIMAFETVELNGGGRHVLKGIHRALLDTVPAAHSAGAKVIWLSADNVGTREFNVGDDVEVVLASNAPRGGQTAETGVEMSVPEVL
jgi:hypothetical protein